MKKKHSAQSATRTRKSERSNQRRRAQAGIGHQPVGQGRNTHAPTRPDQIEPGRAEHQQVAEITSPRNDQTHQSPRAGQGSDGVDADTLSADQTMRLKKSLPPQLSYKGRYFAHDQAHDQAHQRYIDLYDFAPIPYVSFNRSGRIEEVNIAATQLLNRPRAVVLNCPFSVFVWPADGNLFLQHLLRCRQSEDRVESELRLRNAQHEAIPVFLSSTPMTSALQDGQVLFQTAIIDLSERKRTEQALRESQQHLAAALHTARMAAWEWDPEIDKVTASDNIGDIFGLPAGQTLESSAFGISLLHPDDAQQHRELVESAVAARERWHNEFRIIRPRDGRIAWLEERATPVSDLSGRIRVTGLVWDITERKQAEETLRQNEVQLARELEDTKQLHAISSRLVEEDKVEVLYEDILDAAMALMRSDMGSIQMLDAAQGRFRLLAWRGFNTRTAERWQRLVTNAVKSWGASFANGERLIVPDVNKSKLLKNTEVLKHFRSCGAVAMEATPLISRAGQLIGMISTRWRKRHVPDERELRLLDVVARQAADVLERKQAEQKVRQAEERLRLLVEGAKEYAMFMLDLNNRITYWSSGAERVFGWASSEAVGQSGEMIFTPEDRAKRQVEKEIEIARQHGRAADRRWHLRKDGSRVWIDGVMERLNDPQTAELRGFSKVARDATNQRLAEEELRHARDQLEQRVLERTADLMATNNELERTMAQREQLERELLEISERERRRIGQDLHDVICQELTATALFLKSAGNKIDNPEAAQSLSEAAEIVNRNVAIARDLARGFSPVFAASGGLIGALRSLCKKANEVPQIHCTVKLPRAIKVTDEAVALNLFRVAQEAVRNCISHSGGTEITICIEREPELVRLVIEDNGKGFKPRKRSKGLGLHIMHYRTSVLGGEFRIERRPNGGARVVCEVPMKK